MIYRKPDSVARPTRALLVCIAETHFARMVSCPSRRHALEVNGATLLEHWEKAELPVMFAEHAPALERERSYSMSNTSSAREREKGAAIRCSDFSDPSRRPRPGDLVFQSKPASLLRQRRFNRLFEDLGGPLLILIGDELGDIVMETAIDGFLSGYPIIIVKDAAPAGLQNAEATSASRAKALPLLSCFARIMTTEELLGEWSTPRNEYSVRREL